MKKEKCLIYNKTKRNLIYDRLKNILIVIGVTLLITHATIWLGTGAFMIILWKIFDISIYLMLERIAIVFSIFCGIIAVIIDEMDTGMF